MTRPPPVPPASQPQKSRDLDKQSAASPKDAGKKSSDPAARKGRHDNINQNTRNQGYQQDR